MGLPAEKTEQWQQKSRLTVRAFAALMPLVSFCVVPQGVANELKITLPAADVAEYHAPYVAVWLADERERRVTDLAVWYDVDMKNGKGEKWLKDLRLWWRRSGRSQEMPIDGVSGATRKPGTSTIDLANLFHDIPDGNYTLYVEAARELGGREVVSVPLQLPLTSMLQETATGTHEISKIELTLEPSS